MRPLAEEDPTTIDFSSDKEDITDDERQKNIPTEVMERSLSPLLIYDPLPLPSLVESHSRHASEVDPSLQSSMEMRHHNSHQAYPVTFREAQSRSEGADEVAPPKRGRDQDDDEDNPRSPPNLRTNGRGKRYRQATIGRSAPSNGLANPAHSMHRLTGSLLRFGDARRNARIELYRSVDGNALRVLDKDSLAATPFDEMVSIRKSDLFSLAAGFQIGARKPPKLQDYSIDQDARPFMDDTIVSALDTEHRHRQEFNRKLDRNPDIERYAIPKLNCELSIGRVVLTEYQGIRRRYH